MTSSRYLVAALAALTPVCASVGYAQEDVARTATSSPGSYRFVPADASFVFRMNGPSGFERTLGSTNLFRFHQSEAMQAEYGQLFDTILSLAEESGVPPEAVQWIAEMAERLGDYSGEMILAGRLGDAFGPAAVEEDPERVLETAQLFLSMTPAEGFDAEAFVSQLLIPLQEEGGPPTEPLSVGPGFERFVLPIGNDFSVVLPRAVDGGVVLAIGADLEATMTSLFGGQSFDGSRMRSNDATSALSFYLDLSGLGPVLEMIMDKNMADVPEDISDEEMLGRVAARSIIEALGFGDLDSVAGSVSSVQEFVDYEMEVRFHGRAQRAFDFLRVGEGERLPFVDLIPRDATSGSVGRFNLNAAVDMLFEILDEVGAPVGREDLEAEVEGAIGINLQADILDQLTGEVALIQQYEPEAMEQASFVGGLIPFDMTFGLGLNDSARFGELVGSLLELSGLAPEVQESEHAGVTIHTMSLGFFDLEYAFVPEGALLSMGNFEDSRLPAIIDRSNAIASGEAESGWPEKVQRRLDILGRFDGVQVSQIGDLGGSFSQIFDGMSEGLAMDPNTPPAAAELAQGFLRLIETMYGSMAEAGLDTAVSGCRVEDGVFRVRMIQ